MNVSGKETAGVEAGPTEGFNSDLSLDQSAPDKLTGLIIRYGVEGGVAMDLVVHAEAHTRTSTPEERAEFPIVSGTHEEIREALHAAWPDRFAASVE